MAEPLVLIDNESVSVDPGGVARVQLTVTNPGSRVEGYDLSVVGQQDIPWAEVVPPTLSVYPQQNESATVVFSPPTGPGSPGGETVFGVRARSQIDPADSAVVEGRVQVGTVFGLQGEITPATSSGRWKGRHRIELANYGNADAHLRLVPSDPDEALGFLVRPQSVDLPVGGTATAKLTVRTRAPRLRGQVERLPFPSGVRARS